MTSGRRLALPFPASPPMAARAVDGRLHLVAVDTSRWSAAHVALDAEGSFGPAVPLPLAQPTGLAPCGSELLVTGPSLADGRPLLLRLDPDGRPLARTALAARGRLLRWPAPYCPAGRPLVVWERFEGQGSQVLACRADETCEEPRALPVTGTSTQLAVCETATGLLLARVAGTEGDLRLTWLDDELGETAPLLVASGVTAVAAAASAGVTAVAWTAGDDRGLHLQLFDDGHRSNGPAIALDRSPAAASVESLRLLGGGAGRFAVVYRVVAVGGARAGERPPSSVREWAALADAGGRALGPPRPVEPAGTGGGMGGWLGARLLLAHGSRAPLVTIFET